jgi:hypothetical protein
MIAYKELLQQMIRTIEKLQRAIDQMLDELFSNSNLDYTEGLMSLQESSSIFSQR